MNNEHEPSVDTLAAVREKAFREGEARGRHVERQHQGSERTIEPVDERPPPGIPVALSQASHAGLALTTGDLLHRVEQLEMRMGAVELQTGVEPARPDFIEHEPEPQGPVEDTDLEVVGDTHEIEGSAEALAASREDEDS